MGLHITTGSLPPAAPGVSYSYQLEAVGGVTPYTWKVTPGSLPKGLRFTAAGLLTGKVGTHAYPHGGSFPITVTVTDATRPTHQKVTAAFTVVVP